MFASIKELSQALHAKKLSSTELTQEALAKITKHSRLNAFISIDEEYALSQAQAADQALMKGEAGCLTGIPLAHKDNFCTQKMTTTCGSKMLAHFISPYQATIVQRFSHEKTVLIGKTNMDEFAMGSSGETSYFGPVLNPWNLTHVAGGSSSGSAAAVAAGLLPFATGSDTGGSVRQPAAFCGVSGLKPTYGLVSRYGLIAYASSLDQAGLLSRSAEDLALLLNVMAGFDEKDSTSIDLKSRDHTYLLNQDLTGIKIGLPSCFFSDDVDEEIKQVVQEAVQTFTKSGAIIMPVTLDLQPYWVSCYYLIACAEASSNLARFDGLHFGYRSPHGDNLHDLIHSSRQEGFGREVKKRILAGCFTLSSGYFDAYYLKALQVRRLIQAEFTRLFTEVDIILGPTTPTTAFPLGSNWKGTIEGYLADIFTVPANLAGLPALSIPGGFVHGLPVGIQLMAKHFNEPLLLAVAHQYQLQTSWHLQKPTLLEV